MPSGQCRQPLAKGVDGQGRRVVGEVAGDGVSRRGQEAFPLYFKMSYGRSVAPTRVVALSGFDVVNNTIHFSLFFACPLAWLAPLRQQVASLDGAEQIAAHRRPLVVQQLAPVPCTHQFLIGSTSFR